MIFQVPIDEGGLRASSKNSPELGYETLYAGQPNVGAASACALEIIQQRV